VPNSALTALRILGLNAEVIMFFVSKVIWKKLAQKILSLATGIEFDSFCKLSSKFDHRCRTK